MSSDNVDKLYWLAYAKIVQTQIGKLGDKNAIFLGTSSQRGPPVEPYNSAFTDYGIYNIGNQLLDSDNLFYTPSPTNTYTAALMSYLSWVDVGGNPSDAQMLDVMAKKKSFDACQEAAMKELRAANTQYQEMLNLGVVPTGQTFVQWINNNAPGYVNAVAAVNASAGLYKSAVLSLNGPLSPQWGQQMDRLNLAINSYDKDVVPGITMRVTASPPPTITEAYNASTSGNPLPAPTNQYSVAQFGAPSYRNVVNSWQKTALDPPAPTGTFTLDLSEAKNTKDTDFGQIKLGGNLDMSYGSIFSFSVSGSSNTTEETLATKVTETNVKVTMYWDATATVSINPGNWNIANPRADYPKLKPGAPQSAKILVLPTQALLVSKLGYDIEFSGSIKEEFDKKVSKVQGGGGFIRIFGIPVGLGVTASSEKTSTTHTGAWSGASGKFSVKPTGDAGYATILAIVGEKVQTF